MRHIARTLLLVLATCGAVTVVARGQELPEGVTKEMIQEGGTIYSGAGLCHACHGQEGKGIPNLGADLSDDDWIHSDGSLDGIITTISNGVSGDESTVGTTMPPKGGSAISDEQVKAVAAYVWSLSHGDK
jgi:mono/diheme cytochrome c family protein